MTAGKRLTHKELVIRLSKEAAMRKVVLDERFKAHKGPVGELVLSTSEIDQEVDRRMRERGEDPDDICATLELGVIEES